MTITEAKLQRLLGMVSLEYPRVMSRTKHYAFLVKAHSTKLTQLEAMMLLCKLQIKHLTTDKPIQVKFTTKTKSKGGKVKGECWLKLNLTRLTVGLVLHEYSHVLQYQRFSNSEIDPHGQQFVDILDCLVMEYFTNQLS